MGGLGEKEEQAWRQLAREIGAEFVQGGLARRDKVVANVGKWTITLDTFYTDDAFAYTTRMRAPYVARDRFWFSITYDPFHNGCSTPCLFIGLGKLLKRYDIEVGHAEFDRDFFIRANDQSKVRALLANPRIRQLTQSQPSIHLSVIRPLRLPFLRSWSQGASQLEFHVAGVITDVERLKSLFELFEETLNQLCHIGSASEHRPNLESIRKSSHKDFPHHRVKPHHHREDRLSRA